METKISKAQISKIWTIAQRHGLDSDAVYSILAELVPNAKRKNDGSVSLSGLTKKQGWYVIASLDRYNSRIPATKRISKDADVRTIITPAQAEVILNIIAEINSFESMQINADDFARRSYKSEFKMLSRFQGQAMIEALKSIRERIKKCRASGQIGVKTTTTGIMSRQEQFNKENFMARTRVTAPDEILSLQDAEEALAEIGSLQNELDAIDSKGSEQISKIKQKMAKDGELQRARIQALEASLALYAKYNKTELFKEKKTVELATGSFGFRQSTSVRVKKTTVELLKKLYPGRALRVKEEPDKDQLRDWSDDDLATIDAAKTTKDEFGYDVNREEVNKRLLRQAG